MGRVFASSDWHGCGTVANKILDFLKPDDKLYFLGDAIDRGPDGFKIMTKLLNDDRVVYIKGNHEEMMFKTIEHMIQYGIEEFLFQGNGEDDIWIYGNGGETTLNDMNWGKNINLIKLYHQIKNIPFISQYVSKDKKIIILEHAGFTPDKNGKEQYNHNPFWDRGHFYDAWSGAENMYLIHGHTPVQYLKFEYGYYKCPKLTKEELQLKNTWDIESKYQPQVIQYCEGHKFDIDMCTIISKRIALLDLDTFEIIYFDEEGE